MSVCGTSAGRMGQCRGNFGDEPWIGHDDLGKVHFTYQALRLVIANTWTAMLMQEPGPRIPGAIRAFPCFWLPWEGLVASGTRKCELPRDVIQSTTDGRSRMRMPVYFGSLQQLVLASSCILDRP